MKVCKFGGTSVGTVERMKHVAELISESTPKIVVLVRNSRHNQSSEENCSQPVQPRHRAGTRENHPAGIPVHRLANELLTDEIHKAGSDRLYSRPLPATLAIYQ